jgi:glycosyltransferase involved in cell wall biosynthesis
MPPPMPVILATTSALSGVSTWAFRLRDAFREHPRYRVLLMDCFQSHLDARYDLLGTTLEDVTAILAAYAPAIFCPNYLFEILMQVRELEGYDLRYIGVSHSDSAYEYYNALVWYEPIFSHLIGVSETCTAELRSRLPGRADDISTIIYGVPVPPRLERLYHYRPLRLIYAGRIVQQQKRVMDFVELVEHLEARGVSYEFTIAGDGEASGQLQQALKTVIAAGRVKVVGRVPEQDMHHLWMTHDVFVQVSDYEGTSLSMLEAMSHGVIPIVTAATSGTSVIDMGQNGFVVPVGYMSGIAHLIDHLAQNPRLLLHMGQAAHTTARDYSLEQHAARMEAVFDRVRQAPARTWPSERPLQPEVPHNSHMPTWEQAALYKRQFSTTQIT